VRVGAAYKSQVTPSFGSDTTTQQSVFRASAMRLPWQASGGLAYQFGPRPFNPRLVTVEDRLAQTKARVENEGEADERSLKQQEKQADDALRAEYFARPRFYVLVTTEVLILGPSPDSVDLGSLYQDSGRVRRSGEHHTLSGRLGAETEAIPDWLKLRAGTYLEPARIVGATDRVHGTFGFDVKLFRWDVFGLIGDFDWWLASAAVDYAREYLSTSFSIGFWH
jgi:hypothetical protein